MAPYLIVLHGGSWNKQIYEGGTKDYIPLPSSGISFKELLSKLEVRIKKDMSMHTFDIDVIVKVDQGETMRLKVTDELEWSCLMDMMALPVLYVDVCPKSKAWVPNQSIDCFKVAPLNTSCESTSARRRVSSWWIIAGAEQALIEHAEIPMHIEPTAIGQIVCGSVFRSKDTMVSAIHSYHMKHSLEFRTLKSDLKKYYVVCNFESRCEFSL